ncbi:MAG TPA: hypothetical protein VF712_06295 [Thermoleophilaceae bacterium]|jgi:hypothetical protein
MSLLETGVLETAPLPGRRAQGFVVAANHRAAVESLAIDPQDVGQLREGTYLVTVVARDLRSLLHVLGDIAEDQNFLWAARLGPTRVLLSLDQQAELLADKLRVRLEEQNAAVAVERVERQMAPRALREWVAETLDTAPTANSDGGQNWEEEPRT